MSDHDVHLTTIWQRIQSALETSYLTFGLVAKAHLMQISDAMTNFCSENYETVFVAYAFFSISQKITKIIFK